MGSLKYERHFVLVHGSCHGAWCWYKLAPLLRSAGHRVSAMDLAASGTNPKQLEDLKVISDYMEPLMEFMTDLPADEKVVLVGHSMGGVAISVAMEKFPRKIAVAVFVTAFMHGPNLTMKQIQYEWKPGSAEPGEIEFWYTNGSNNPPTSFLFGPKYISNTMYQLSPPEDLSLASTLARPCPSFHDEKSEKEILLTEKNYGSVHRVYIMSGQDKGLHVELQKYMIDRNPPDEVKEIPDSDHMVMNSKPQELCSYLLEIAEKYY
ncbi:hypothetical protein LguiA_017430 [Lonicera macranthoides]